MPPDTAVRGPLRATPADVDELNRVFSEAFTDRYHRDGLGGVRVPLLNPAVWRYAIAAAGEGALLWRDGKGILGFNLVHAAGVEGWMGPLAVRTDRQGGGLGRAIVETGVALLKQRGCRIIGLETMPRTIDNIGFYSGLGFRPGHLTISLILEVEPGPTRDGTLESEEPDLDACRRLTDALAPGLDFTREIALTREQALGDVSVVAGRGGLQAFGLWHSAPLAATRTSEEVRLLKVVASDLESFRRLLVRVADAARRLGRRRVAVRCQTAYRGAYGVLLAHGFRAHWTDLRMYLEGHEEEPPDGSVVFSNWEI